MLKWETACASRYKIQISNDAQNWTDVAEITDGKGKTEIVPISGKGRYVRMLGIKRATQFGYSLWEFEVYPAKNQDDSTRISRINKALPH